MSFALSLWLSEEPQFEAQMTQKPYTREESDFPALRSFCETLITSHMALCTSCDPGHLLWGFNGPLTEGSQCLCAP